MKKYIGVLVAWAVVTISMADYVEPFDGDNANFTYGYGTDFTEVTPAWNDLVGNPGGYISGALDNLSAIWTYETAAFGDISGGGLMMTIDTKLTGTLTSGTAQFYVGRDNTYYLSGDLTLVGTGWITTSVALDSANFTILGSGSTLDTVLQAPDDIGIWFSGSVADGSGDLEVDNFGVTAIPEPAVLTMVLATGISTLFIRRKFM